MKIFLTIIFIAIAFVIGLLIGRILKMSFGCKGQESVDSSATAAASTTDTASAQSATATNAGLMSADTSASASTATGSGSSSVAAKTSSTDDKKAADTKESASAKPAAKAKATKKATKSAKSTKKSAAPKTAITAKKTSTTKKTSVAASAEADDLKKIKGVGKLNETRLNDEGITTYAQVAAWKKADIATFDEKLNFKGRIEREEWVPQAKALAKEKSKATGGAKKTAKTASAGSSKKSAAASANAKKAAPAKSAAKTTTAKKPAAKKAAPKKPKTPDDLKLIKGVGKTIETKLAKEGITTYAQIAAWKKADITDFDEKLSFKGRIERDEWVKQAKVLAKGGSTEFSKRAKKGEVPSSS